MPSRETYSESEITKHLGWLKSVLLHNIQGLPA